MLKMLLRLILKIYKWKDNENDRNKFLQIRISILPIVGKTNALSYRQSAMKQIFNK